MSDLPDWVNKPPLSPTEQMRHYGYGYEDPASILRGPAPYDVRAHYAAVKALYDRYPYRDLEVCRDRIKSTLTRIFRGKLVPSQPFYAALFGVIADIFEKEAVYAPNFNHAIDDPPTSTWFDVVVRPALTREERFYSDYQRIVEPMENRLEQFFSRFIELAPQAAFTEQKDASVTVPLLDFCQSPKDLVHACVSFFASAKEDDRIVYPKLSDQLWSNLLEVSKLKPEQLPDKADRLILPLRFDGSASDACLAYLKDTPFLEFLMTPIPFAIPESYRFEHAHVVAGTGHGKTQFLQQEILSDLSQASPPSLIVIDSQGDMLGKIQRLAVFAPGQRLADRLVIIDPEDDCSPALNMFDMTTGRLAGYTRLVREQIEAGIIELYNYIFGALAAELTQKQGTAFAYVSRLMLSIPGATIHMLRELMEDGADRIEKSPFKDHIERLDRTSKAFFQNQFFSKSFAQTKQQIARRLYGILQVPSFDRMFSSARNRLDMFEAMQSGRIVLINTSKALLKSEASALFGRYMIALTLKAAYERVAVPERDRRPAFLIVDEAAEYFDEGLENILSQARKYNLGLLFAHQYLDQLAPELRSSVAANTSIKLAGGVSDRDARALAPDMRTDAAFISSMGKRTDFTEFACYVRNYTATAVRLRIPLGVLEAAPTMSEAAHRALLVQNRARYGVTEEPSPTPPGPESVQPPHGQSGGAKRDSDPESDAAEKW